jgi:hypothetical protein
VASWTVSDRGFTSDEIIRLVTIAIDKLIISKCKEKRYDSPDSFPRYINSNPISGTDTYDIEMRYKTESIAATNWISQVWAKAEIIMMNVQLGNRPMPTINEVLSELPVFNWNEI